MDWDKYKRYTNYDYQGIINFWDKINNVSTTNVFSNYTNDNVVADVTDSYKELSSERIKEQNGSNDNV